MTVDVADTESEATTTLSDHVARAAALETDQTLGRRWLPWVLQGSIALFVFLNLRPDLVFSNSRPIGADFVVHNAAIDLIDHNLWNHGLLSGWSWWWSAGFPAFRFYMPVPLLLAWVLGWALPTAVALKVVAVAPLVAFPYVVSRFIRTTGLGLMAQTTAALATVVYLFESHQHVFGGNIASTLVGEYPYEWAMLFALLSISAFWSDLDAGRRGARTGVLIALAALFHPIGGVWAVVGCLVIAAARPLEQRMRTLRHGARSLMLATAIAAFWYVPFIWYGGYSISTTFDKRTDFAFMLLPYSTAIEVILWTLAALGVITVIRRRQRALFAVLALWALSLVAVFALPRNAFTNSRQVPYALLFRMVFVGIGTSLLISLVLALVRRPRQRAAQWSLALCALTLFATVSYNLATLPFGHRTAQHLGNISLVSDYKWLVGPSRQLDSWSQYPSYALSGLEDMPKYPELQQLLGDLEKLKQKYGCGRIAYEFDPTGSFGSPYAFQLLPQLTHGCFTVVNGLVSGSPTSDLQFIGETAWSYQGEHYFASLPTERLDIPKSVKFFHELGVRYYFASSQFAVTAAESTPSLTPIATSGSTYIFGIDDAAVVEPLAAPPVVDTRLDDRTAWSTAAQQYFQMADTTAQRFATDGPSSWPRGTWSTTAAAKPASATDVKIANFAGGTDWLAFDVSKPGVPILVRVTYFPTWEVQGADGPYRVAPNWMVVVPRSTHVRLENHTTFVEVGSSLVTLGGIGVAVWLALRTRRAKRALAAA